jgi:hypothetical protein
MHNGRVLVEEPGDGHGNPYSLTLRTLYFNLLSFCEDFIAFALNIAMAPALALHSVSGSAEWNPQQRKYSLVMSGPIVPAPSPNK